MPTATGLVLAALCLATSGCGGGGTLSAVEALCAGEKFGCEDNDDELPASDQCSTGGGLEVELGHGESSFSSLPSKLPPVHKGGQGGFHAFLAVRVGNVVASRSRWVAATIRVSTGRSRESPTRRTARSSSARVSLA